MGLRETSIQMLRAWFARIGHQFAPSDFPRLSGRRIFLRKTREHFCEDLPHPLRRYRARLENPEYPEWDMKSVLLDDLL